MIIILFFPFSAIVPLLFQSFVIFLHYKQLKNNTDMTMNIL